MDFQEPHEFRMTMILFLTMIIAAILLSGSAQAYIPSSQFVFERVASQHGKGSYVIEDEVVFSEMGERIVIRENWMVIDGGEMRVSANADGLRVFKILRKGKNYWVDQDGSERADEPSSDYFMHTLLTRNAVDEKKAFARWGVLPAEVFRDRRNVRDIKDVKVETESFVRLARVAGTIAYAYGKPAPIEGAAPASLWIEQDAFTIRKMRTPTGAEISCNNFSTYSKNLLFPRTQTVIFNGHAVEIRVTKIQSLDFSAEQKRQLDSSFLRTRQDVSAIWPKSSLGTVVQEFYKRFR